MENLRKFEVIENLALEALKGGAKKPTNPEGDCRETSPGLWDAEVAPVGPVSGFGGRKVRNTRS